MELIDKIKQSHMVTKTSLIGKTLRIAMFILSFTIITVFMLLFYFHVKNLMEINGENRLQSMAGTSGGIVTTVATNCVGLNKTLANSFALCKSDSMHVSYTRDNIKQLLKAGFAQLPTAVLQGVYWEWNGFDGKDGDYADNKDYAKYYGRMCYFYTKPVNSNINTTASYSASKISPELSYEFDEGLYNQMKLNKDATVFPPQEMSVDGRKMMVMPVMVPIMDRGTTYGCVFSLLKMDYAYTYSKMVRDTVDKAGEILLLDDQFSILANTRDSSHLGRKVSECFAEMKLTPDFISANQGKTVTLGNNRMVIYQTPIATASQSWYSIAYMPESELTNGIISKMSLGITIGLILLIISIITALVIGFRIGEPIKNMVVSCKQFSEGNLNVKVKYGTFKDDTEIRQLADIMNTSIKNISKIVTDVKQSAVNMNNAGKELARSASQMASGANEQASASEQVASAMEDMTASIRKNAQNAQQTEDITNGVVESVQQANASVSETVEAMKTITDKIGIIDEIAGRTDLLAVNAAIEAARVGELGKGFSVVAAEIRKLAEKSQAAAKEIGELTKSGVSQAEASGQMLQELVPEINKTSNLVHEIAASSIEQNNNAMQVNNALQQLNSITQQNAATAEELSTSADETQSQAESLDETMTFFHLADDTDTKIAALNKKAADILKHIDELRQEKENN